LPRAQANNCLIQHNKVSVSIFNSSSLAALETLQVTASFDVLIEGVKDSQPLCEDNAEPSQRPFGFQPHPHNLSGLKTVVLLYNSVDRGRLNVC
jgi:hypothetical protein